jgi:hypothetical protein
MKTIRQILIFAGSLIAVAAIVTAIGCEKETIEPSTTSQALARKGGNGKGTGGNTPAPDTLLQYCGITLSDTGSWYPTVQLNNIAWRKETRYSYDPVTAGYTHPYDVLILTCNPAVIPGKTVTCYMLLADQCQGRPVCSKGNGLYLSQVTTCATTGYFCLPIGVSWLNPSVPTYTGVIVVGTSDGCLYYSQPFNFEPPRVL